MNRIITSAMLAAGLALGSTFAAADDLITQRVRISDLNLASIEGQHTLVQRVNRAIDQVCTQASATEISKLRRRETKDGCVDQARGSVELQLADRGLRLPLVAGRR